MELRKEIIERIYFAGLLHDVGKIGIPDAIITKPERLTVDEYEEIKKHPGIGAKILEPVEFLHNIVPCVRHHHEWFDGSERGYPDYLIGDQIPLPSRVILVADTVEAMTSDRPYRNALPIDVVVQELHKYSGSQFDPVVVTPSSACSSKKARPSSPRTRSSTSTSSSKADRMHRDGRDRRETRASEEPAQAESNVLGMLGFGPESLLMNDPKLFVDVRFLGNLLGELEVKLGQDGARTALFQIGLACTASAMRAE